jgi:hypothetical protein
MTAIKVDVCGDGGMQQSSMQLGKPKDYPLSDYP